MKIEDLKYFRFFEVTLNDNTIYIITNDVFDMNDLKKVYLSEDNIERLNRFDYFYNKTKEQSVVIEKDKIYNPYI